MTISIWAAWIATMVAFGLGYMAGKEKGHREGWRKAWRLAVHNYERILEKERQKQ